MNFQNLSIYTNTFQDVHLKLQNTEKLNIIKTLKIKIDDFKF